MTRLIVHNYFPRRRVRDAISSADTAREDETWEDFKRLYRKWDAGKASNRELEAHPGHKLLKGVEGERLTRKLTDAMQMKPYIGKYAGKWELIDRFGKVVASATTQQQLQSKWDEEMRLYNSSRDGGPGSGPQPGGGSGPLELTEQAKPRSRQELKKGAQAEKKHKEDFNKKHFAEWQAKQKSSPTPAPRKYEAPKSKQAPLELKDSQRDAPAGAGDPVKLKATGRTLVQYVDTRRAAREWARAKGYNAAQEAFILEGWMYQRRVEGLSENV